MARGRHSIHVCPVEVIGDPPQALLRLALPLWGWAGGEVQRSPSHLTEVKTKVQKRRVGGSLSELVDKDCTLTYYLTPDPV